MARKLPAAFKAHQFKKGSTKAKVAGKKGGTKSRPGAKKK